MSAEESAPYQHCERREGWTLVDGNYIAYFVALRDARNAEPLHAPGRVPWTPDKFRFDRFARSAGARTPQTLALISNGKVQTAGSATISAAEFIRGLPAGHYFCKPNVIAHGWGALALEISGGTIRVNGTEQSFEELASTLSSKAYLVQVSLTPRQLPAIARFHRRSISTMRLITFNEGVVFAEAAAMRIATGAAVDNWTEGSFAVPVDLATGELGRFGLGFDFGVLERHPLSGIAFAGTRVDVQAAVAMATRVHEKLAARSLGWDIALLEDGPCIIECNLPWGPDMPCCVNPHLAPRFLQFHLRPPDSFIRWDFAGTFEDLQMLRLWICKLVGAARASGRVDHFSRERLVLTVAGSRLAFEEALRAFPSASHGIGTVKASAAPVRDNLRPGLDLDATFAGDIVRILPALVSARRS